MKKIIFILSITLLLTGCSSSKVIGCDNCVFARNTNAVKIGEEFTKYKKDYKKLNKKFFLGYKLDKNNKITKGYICGVEKNKAYCLESNNKGSKYDNNKKILDKVYSKEKCKEDSYEDKKYYICSGDTDVNINSEGHIYIGSSKSDQCYAYNNGMMYCYTGEFK